VAELLSPGVFMEVVPSQNNIIEGVSTSNGAFVGYTERGPENDARLVSSFQQYLQLFGPYTRESRTALSVAKFFENGGARAYVVRVVPADATAADAKVLSQHKDDAAVTSTGIPAVAATALTTGLAVNGGDTPIQPGSLSIKWRAAGTAFTGEQATARDGVTLLATVGGTLHYEGRVPPSLLASLHDKLLRLVPGATTTITWQSAGGPLLVTIAAPVSGTVGVGTNGGGSTAALDFRTGVFSLRIHPTETPDDAQAIDVAGTPAVGDPGAAAFALIGSAAPNSEVRIDVDAIGAAGNAFTVTVIDPSPDISSPLGATWNGTSLVVSLATDGVGALDPAANTGTLVAAQINIAAAGDLTAAPTGTGAVALAAAEALQYFSGGRDATAYFAVADDGAGLLVESVGEALTGTGLIDYDTGAFSFLTHVSGPTLPNSVPFNTEILLADYTIAAWDLDPVSRGTWAHNLRVSISGSSEAFDPFTASYRAFNVAVEIYNPAVLGFEVLERYEEIDFSDPNAARFFPAYISQISGLFSANAIGGDEPPLQLNGRNFVHVLGGGNEAAPGKVFSSTTSGALSAVRVGRRSVSITYVSAVDGETKTITDTGAGILSGSVDPTAVNTINYITGAFSFTTLEAVKSGTLVQVSYYQEPAATVSREQFGDTDKGYTTGTDGTFDATNYGRNQFTDIALSATNGGIYALDRLDILCQLCVPDFAGDVQITKDILGYVDNRELLPAGPDRFALLTGPETIQNAQDLRDWLQFEVNTFSKYAAFYGPWVRVPDPLRPGTNVIFPPLGLLAGIYARTDTTKNVAKTPAGTSDGQLRGISSLAAIFGKGQQDILTPAKINALISTPLTGNVVWGARTLSQLSEWRYISAVRTLMFLSRSIYNATQWIVFENNNPQLWARIKTQLDGFLGRLTNDGYFASGIASQAFRVQVDAKNNSQATIDAGQVIIDVSFAPTKPAEFVRFRIAQLQAT
jgi:phage tail sheath protein FI